MCTGGIGHPMTQEHLYPPENLPHHSVVLLRSRTSKAMRAFSLCLGLVSLFHLTSASTSSTAANDAIAEVGLGSVHPLCDSLVSECISSDEQAQDDILDRLEADEAVTGEP